MSCRNMFDVILVLLCIIRHVVRSFGPGLSKGKDAFCGSIVDKVCCSFINDMMTIMRFMRK